jgi:hypothetical protein
MKNIFFNAHHSPIGAFASFTLGFKGNNGGLGLELGKPAEQNVYIGLESIEGGYYEALPFFGGSDDEAKRYDIEKNFHAEIKPIIIPYQNVKRDFKLCSDCFKAGDLTFTIYSQVSPVPDPEASEDNEIKKVIVPAVFAEITIDNSNNPKARRAFFGYQGNEPNSSMRRLDDTTDGNIIGVGQGLTTAIATKDKSVKSALGFAMEAILNESIEENWTFGLGAAGALIMEVPAGEKRTYKFSIGFFRQGIATAGMETCYFYNRYFKNIEAVLDFTLDNFDELVKTCINTNGLIDNSKLSQDQKFMMSHAIRSYYGSTELLDHEGKAFWVVNEGEYRMMNTFDLTVDQLFFEMNMNPWTVRNELDMFVERFSYYDTVKLPGEDKEYPGGISFTHDMGVVNTISRKGYSSYEKYGIDGCFSHMTHEQLTNWICSCVCRTVKR